MKTIYTLEDIHVEKIKNTNTLYLRFTDKFKSDTSIICNLLNLFIYDKSCVYIKTIHLLVRYIESLLRL